MKSGKTHQIGLSFPEFNELFEDEYDAIGAGDYLNDLIVHVFQKDSIESVEVIWTGTREELDELAREIELENSEEEENEK
jgi:hypothetical protein